MVVNRHPISGGKPRDPGAQRADDPRRLVPEHSGQARRYVPVRDVRGAHTAGEHVAYDLARSWLGVVQLLESDVPRGE